MLSEMIDIRILANELLEQFGGPNQPGAWYRAAKYGLGNASLRAGLWRLLNDGYITKPVSRALLEWSESTPPVVELPPGALVLSDVDLSINALVRPCPCGQAHTGTCARGRRAARLARSSEPELLAFIIDVAVPWLALAAECRCGTIRLHGWIGDAADAAGVVSA